MKNKEQEFKVLPNGDVEATQLYNGNEVTIQMNGEDIVIGSQADYNVKQIILKDKIDILLKFVTEQKKEVQKRLDSANEVIEKLEHIDIDTLSKAIMKLPQDKMTSKHLKELNQLTQDFYMKKSAIDNKKILETNLEKFDPQIDFLSKLI